MATLGTLEYQITIDSSKVSSGLTSAEQKVKGFGDQLSTWAVAKGNIISSLVTRVAGATVEFASDAIQERMKFDSAMSQVAATLGKTVDEMNTEVGEVDTSFGHFEGTLSDFARFMGANTAFTATEAAQALNYMALAGYDAQKSMNMLPNVLNLAAAGNFDLARASDMVTDAQSALGLGMDETNVLVDQMARTASRTNTSVSQLGEAILTVGGTAKMMKGGTTELSAVLGVLADNGIKGSEGGTALRNILLSLSAPTDKAKKSLDSLGVSVFDESGNMRSLTDIMTDFGKATKGMTDQQRAGFINDIFNKRDLKSVEALLGTTTDRWAQLNEEISNADGSSSSMAGTQLDNLQGDITKLNSALSELKLNVVEGITPGLRKLAQWATSFIQDLNGIVDKIQEILGFNIPTKPHNGSNGKLSEAQVNNLSWEYNNRVKDDLGNYNNDNFTKALKSDMEAAGFSADEIKSAVDAITSGTISPSDITTFLTNLGSANEEATAVKDTLDSIPGEYNATVNITTNGDSSFLPKAKGDWNVPYDNYLASLHRGEMVLTASQARRYREGATGRIDTKSLAASIVGAIRDGMDGATVNSYMNGNKVSRETNRVTGNLIAARRFATT